MERITKQEFYLNVAKTISERSTCIHAHVGAILVKDDMIIAQGYNGSPRGKQNCCDLGQCQRDLNVTVKVGSPISYESCVAVHAEMNTIINAARHHGGVIGATMYVHYERVDKRKVKRHVCKLCQAVILNAGIKEIITDGE